MLLVGFSFSARAQNGQITGNVLDSFGALIPNAKIKFRDETGKIVQTLSNDDGRYQIELPEGLYEITFEKRPFTTFRVTDYWLYEAAKLRLDVSMRCVGCQIVNEGLNWRKNQLLQTADYSFANDLLLTHSNVLINSKN